MQTARSKCVSCSNSKTSSPTQQWKSNLGMPSSTHKVIEAVWRIESAKVIAHVARLVRDVGVAEELAQDALVSAMEHWTIEAMPDNPGAWLMATAKNRALDRLRQDALHARKHEEL